MASLNILKLYAEYQNSQGQIRGDYFLMKLLLLFLHLFLHDAARSLITIPLLCTASVFIQFVFKNYVLSYPESVV